MIELTPAFFVIAYLIAYLLVFLIGISKAGFAGELSALGVSVLSLFISPTLAVGILLPILIFIDSINLWTYRNHYQKQ